MIDINKNLTIKSNGNKLSVMKIKANSKNSNFFIVSLEDKENIMAKTIDIQEAKNVVAYLNAHIILTEND